MRSGLTLTVSQEAVVNFGLEVGAASQTATVTAEALLVDTTTGSLGGTVDEQKVANLPLNGRNYIDLALLQTGVSLDVNRPQGEATWYSSNGASVRSNYYMLDGTPTRNLYGTNPSSRRTRYLLALPEIGPAGPSFKPFRNSSTIRRASCTSSRCRKTTF